MVSFTCVSSLAQLAEGDEGAAFPAIHRGQHVGMVGLHRAVLQEERQEFAAPGTAPRKLVLYATQAPDYATLQFRVNGQDLPAKFDGYAASVQPAAAFLLGTFEPRDGKFTLRAEVAGANPAAKGAMYFFGLDCVILEKP